MKRISNPVLEIKFPPKCQCLFVQVGCAIVLPCKSGRLSDNWSSHAAMPRRSPTLRETARA